MNNRKLLLIFISFLIIFSACRKEKVELKIESALSQKDLTLKPGDTISILIKDANYSKDYKWSFKNADLISVEKDSNLTLTIVAQKTGEAVAYVTFPSTNRVDSCLLHIGKPNMVRVLAIGNSFSVDALEQHLAPLFKAANIEIVIGNLYYGGSDLDFHAKNIIEDLSVYSYHKVGITGVAVDIPNTSIKYALADENWDYISFQQVSSKSGIPESFTIPLPIIFKKVQELNSYSNTKYILHQTWAYAPYYSETNFIKLFNSNQYAMYNSICESYKYAQQLTGIKSVVPSGTAIQNARQTTIGDDLTRDGFHLAYNTGRYIASCTWFEKLTRTSVVGNTYYPAEMKSTDKLLAQQSAHEANKKPFAITKIN